MVPSKAQGSEEDCQKCESHDLDGFSANGVDEGDSDPVSRNSTSANEDEVTDSSIVVNVVNILTTSVAELCKNHGVVQTDSIECNIEEEP